MADGFRSLGFVSKALMCALAATLLACPLVARADELAGNDGVPIEADAATAEGCSEEGTDAEDDAADELVANVDTSADDGLNELELSGIDDLANIAEGSCGSCWWYITQARELVIVPKNGIEGTLDNWSDGIVVPNAPWNKSGNRYTKARVVGTVHATTCCSFFWEQDELESVDLSGLETSQVKDMRMMFARCSSLASVDVSGLDTSHSAPYRTGCERLHCPALRGMTPAFMKHPATRACQMPLTFGTLRVSLRNGPHGLCHSRVARRAGQSPLHEVELG